MSAFEKWWLALANSDDPIVNELDSLNLSQQATVVTFCKRAFAAEDGLEAQNPLQVAAPEPRIEYELRIDTPEQVFTLFTLHPRDRIDQIRKLGYLDIEDGGETHVIPWHSITGFTYKERA